MKTVLEVASLFSVLSAFLFSLSAAGETYRLAYSEAGTSQSGWTTAANWTLDGTTAGTAASSFSSADEFLVPAWSTGYTLRTPASSVSTSWTGKCLRLGSMDKKNTSYLAILRHETRKNDSTVTYENDGLFLDSRSRYQAYYGDGPCLIKGHVTVESVLSAYPATLFSGNKDNARLSVLDDFSGATGTYAAIHSKKANFKVTLADPTRFYGTLTVTNEGETASSRLILGNDFPGVLKIGKEAVLETPANGTVNVLSLDAGVTIDATAGAFAVTNAFAHDGPVKIVVSPREQSVDWQPLVTLPKGCDATKADLDFVLEDGSPFVCDEMQFVETEQGLTVAALIRPVVRLLSSDSTSRTRDYSSAMTNAAQWSDNEWPTNPAVAYLADDRNLRTFDSNFKKPEDDFVFVGHSLTMDDATLVIVNRSFDARQLVLRNGATVAPSPYFDGTIKAPIVCESGTVSVSTYTSTWTLSNEISGSGTLKLLCMGGSGTTTPYGRVVLRGTNTAFTGSMLVTIPVNTPSDPVKDYARISPRFDKNFVTLYLSDKRNLGGPLATPNPKALTLQNMSVLALVGEVTDLALDDATRGVFIDSCGRFRPDEGQSLTIASPLALQGTLWKEGDGTLVLANPAPTFGADATQALPDAEATNHTFVISAGDVKIASADAVNGLDVVVSNTASRLVLDVTATDADLRTYGIRNVKTTAPFGVMGEVEKVTVLLTAPTALTEEVSVAVATVQADVADQVEGFLRVKKAAALKGFGVTLSREDVTVGELSCVTFKATIVRTGSVLFIR